MAIYFERTRTLGWPYHNQNMLEEDVGLDVIHAEGASTPTLCDIGDTAGCETYRTDRPVNCVGCLQTLEHARRVLVEEEAKTKPGWYMVDTECCQRCGDALEAYTPRSNWYGDGDPCRCVSCHAAHSVSVDDDGVFFSPLWDDWERCGQCGDAGADELEECPSACADCWCCESCRAACAAKEVFPPKFKDQS